MSFLKTRFKLKLPSKDTTISALLATCRTVSPFTGAIPLTGFGEALDATIWILERIKLVGDNNENTREIARRVVSVIEIVQLTGSESIASEDFKKLVDDFKTFLIELRTEIEKMDAESNLKGTKGFKKKLARFLKAEDIKEKIEQFEKRLDLCREEMLMRGTTSNHIGISEVRIDAEEIERQTKEVAEKTKKVAEYYAPTRLDAIREVFRELKEVEIELADGVRQQDILAPIPETPIEPTAGPGDQEVTQKVIGYRVICLTSKSTYRKIVDVYPLNEGGEQIYKDLLDWNVENPREFGKPQLFAFCEGPHFNALVYHLETAFIEELPATAAGPSNPHVPSVACVPPASGPSAASTAILHGTQANITRINSASHQTLEVPTASDETSISEVEAIKFLANLGVLQHKNAGRSRKLMSREVAIGLAFLLGSVVVNIILRRYL